MNFNITRRVLVFSMTAVISLAFIASAASPPEKITAKPAVKKESKKKTEKKRVTLKEAKSQTKLLHDTFHLTLQVMHQQYFRPADKTPIPSRTLDIIFEEMTKDRDIQFRWISVNAQAMSIDHEPETKFEKKAAKEIASGKASYEQIEKGLYRRAGRIQLLNQCLKCHLPDRTSTKTRFAALIISMPISK